MEQPCKYDISVVVATCGRPHSILDTLHSLIHQQGLAGKKYEIIVVDNNFDDFSIHNVNAYKDEHEEDIKRFNAAVKVVKERRKGLFCRFRFVENIYD